MLYMLFCFCFCFLLHILILNNQVEIITLKLGRFFLYVANWVAGALSRAVSGVFNERFYYLLLLPRFYFQN